MIFIQAFGVGIPEFRTNHPDPLGKSREILNKQLTGSTEAKLQKEMMKRINDVFDIWV